MQRNDSRLQLSTYLRYAHRLSSLRRQHHKQTRILPSPVVALYFKYRARHETSTCVLAEATYHGPCLPAHRINPSFPRLEIIHSSSSTSSTSHPAATGFTTSTSLSPPNSCTSLSSTAGCMICSESHMSECPHRGVRLHHSMARCVICSESHMSEL